MQPDTLSLLEKCVGLLQAMEDKAVFGRVFMKSVGQEVQEPGARQKEASAGMIDSQAVNNDRTRGPKERLPTKFR